MKKIRLTESELIKFVKRIIKEQEMSNNDEELKMFMEKRDTREVEFENKDSHFVSQILKNLPPNIERISLINCEMADFSDIDMCEFPSLTMVDLSGTKNNFEKMDYVCSREIGNNKFTFS